MSAQIEMYTTEQNGYGEILMKDWIDQQDGIDDDMYDDTKTIRLCHWFWYRDRRSGENCLAWHMHFGGMKAKKFWNCRKGVKMIGFRWKWRASDSFIILFVFIENCKMKSQDNAIKQYRIFTKRVRISSR